MVGPINPAGQPGLQAEVSKAAPKPQASSTQNTSGTAPTDSVNVPLTDLATDVDVPANLDAARDTAKKASSQLSGQTLNIANVRTQQLSTLFRAA